MTYQEVMDEINATNAFGNFLGIKIEQVEAGYAKVSLEMKPEYTNPYNTAHGGVLYTMADMAGGTAAYSYGQPVVTVDSNFHFLNAGRNVTKLIGIGKELRNGKQIGVYEVLIMDQDENLLCSGTFTYAKIPANKVRNC
ncbi:MAG: PaaI family thioesterase [Eubacteriales bacterium]|nr:PaaI family thioesterase [Eubacteriales bacterium]